MVALLFTGFHKVFAKDSRMALSVFPSTMTIVFGLNLVNEAKEAGVKYIVKQSILGADAEPGITPDSLHRQAEKVIEESEIPFTFLRPNHFMQLRTGCSISRPKQLVLHTC